MEKCFHGNQISWGINHSFVSLYSKYHPYSFNCSSIMLAPRIWKCALLAFCFYLGRRQSLPLFLNNMTTSHRENRVADSESMRQLTGFFDCLLSINSWIWSYAIVCYLSSKILNNLLGHIFQGLLFAKQSVARLT